MNQLRLVVLLVAVGFVSVRALGAWLFADLSTSTAVLLLVPTASAQIALPAGLGMWAGVMYVMLRPGLPFSKTWARVAFFAFCFFGHNWTWFHAIFRNRVRRCSARGSGRWPAGRGWGIRGRTCLRRICEWEAAIGLILNRFDESHFVA